MTDSIYEKIKALCSASSLTIADESLGVGRRISYQKKPDRTVVVHFDETENSDDISKSLLAILSIETKWYLLNRYGQLSASIYSKPAYKKLVEFLKNNQPDVDDDLYLIGSSGHVLIPYDHYLSSDGMAIHLSDINKTETILSQLNKLGAEFEVSTRYDVTDRKSSGRNPYTHQVKKDVLRENAQNLEITLNSIGDAVITTDANGQITRINPTAARLTGWLAEDAVGLSLKTVFPIIDASTRDSIDNPVDKVIATGETVYLSNHTTLISKDGTEYQINDSAAPIRDENGNIQGMVLVFNDVTEQYHLREAIKESEERFRQLAENVNEVFWLGSPDWHEIFYISPAYEKNWGQSPEDLYQNPRLWIESVHPDDRQQVIDDIPKDITSIGDYVNFREYRIQKSDGDICWIKARAYPIFNDDGLIIRVAGIAEDVTERVEAGEALRNSEAWLAEAQRVAHFGSWNLNLNTSRADWSKELYRLLGYEPYSVDPIPENFLGRVHEDDRDYVVKELGRPFQEENREYRAEFRVVLADNQVRWISERGRLFYDGEKDPQRYVGTSLDITERKQQEAKLRQSQKMDALGKLTGGISHDYNNLLGIILGYSELLNMQLTHEPMLQEYVKEISHAAERGTTLTKKLLAFSQNKATNSELLNINALLKEEQHMLEKTLTARIKLNFNLTKDLWPVELDGGDLEDAVINLSINAMHAMPDGGQLTVDTSNERLDAAEAELLHLRPGEYVLLKLTDTGCGMDEATKEKIFEPFFTTKGDLGSGLGLSQVYGFVERSGGTIQLYSEPGHGSCFALYFPRSYHAETDTSDTESGATQNLRGSETLLVVDDEPALRELAKKVLSTQGYRVLTANDGEQALLLLETETVDLVLSDVIMPNMDGYQLAAKVQQNYSHIKIQMISGFADDRHSNTDNIALHKNLLHKPYSSDTLLSRVRNLLDEK